MKILPTLMTNIQNKAENFKENARNKSENLQENIQENLESTGKNIQSNTENARENVRTNIDTAVKTTQQNVENAKETVRSNFAGVSARAEGAKNMVGEKLENVKENLQENLSNVGKIASDPTNITPPTLKAKSTASDLLNRLNWGEPALTIIDVRAPEAVRSERIKGAIGMPFDRLVSQVQGSLEKNRDIYVYGESDNQTSQAVSALREAGFTSVAELEGGLQAWKASAGPTEGTTMSV